MIKIKKTEIVGLEPAIRGMRNPMNSWELSDSEPCMMDACGVCGCNDGNGLCLTGPYIVGSNDHQLMTTLRNAGTDHRKYMRMIVVYLDITAPLYWWKEFDTYKVGTVANSCSTMHKIHEKEFTLEDFSCEHLTDGSEENDDFINSFIVMGNGDSFYDYNLYPKDGLEIIIDLLNKNRKMFIETKNKKYWWQMIQLLPSSYNQKRTIMLNYEVLANMYRSRKAHKLDEWRLHDTPIEHRERNKDFASGLWGFCDWIESLPYSELITGKIEKEEK